MVDVSARRHVEPPGPEITAADQPALFAEIAKISELTGEQMPKHVYVMYDMNAFVAQRGGIMGFGSRRVMGVGLPLMRVLGVSELRAVLAHEMGHSSAETPGSVRGSTRPAVRSVAPHQPHSGRQGPPCRGHHSLHVCRDPCAVSLVRRRVHADHPGDQPRRSCPPIGSRRAAPE